MQKDAKRGYLLSKKKKKPFTTNTLTVIFFMGCEPGPEALYPEIVQGNTSRKILLHLVGLKSEDLQQPSARESLDQ